MKGNEVDILGVGRWTQEYEAKEEVGSHVLVSVHLASHGGFEGFEAFDYLQL